MDSGINVLITMFSEDCEILQLELDAWGKICFHCVRVGRKQPCGKDCKTVALSAGDKILIIVNLPKEMADALDYDYFATLTSVRSRVSPYSF